MRLRDRLAATTLTAAVAACVPVAAAQAATPHGTATHPGTEHCVLVLGRLQPGSTTSPVVGRQCAASEAALHGIQAGSTLLVTLYQNTGYNGNSTQLRGNGGPCDATGYGFPSFDAYWRHNISSFKVWNNCNVAIGFTNDNYGGGSQTWRGDQWYVGSAMNDRIVSMRVHS
jgi:hypothetical protein